MAPSRLALYRRALLVVLGVILLGAIVYLLVLALGGAQLLKATPVRQGSGIEVHDPRGWLIAATAAALLTLLGWGVSERRLDSLEGAQRAAEEARAAEEQARRRLTEVEEERDQRERAHQEEVERLERERREEVGRLEEERREEVGRLEQERDEERAREEEAADAWRREREWNRELRDQIARLQKQHGLLGRHDDVRDLVLELTMGLVDAEKGILLSDRETANGQLQVVSFLGFENDPYDSGIAQRFASEVIEYGNTIREDDESQMQNERRSAADDEVHNLLAIPIYMADEFSGVIVCANREDGFENLADEVLVAVGDHAGAVLQNSRLHGDLRNAYLSTIRVLANAIELKDPELRGHSDAVSEYVLAVADQLEFEPRQREELIFASLLHDVGKLGISERILLKPAGLTAEERAVIQLHPRIGYQLVRQVPALETIAPAVLHHHERFDGDGYPGSLRGEAIPLEARIIAVADAFSAMVSDRPYRRGCTAEEACQELERCAGTQFDPQVVALFVEEVRRNPPDHQASTPLVGDPELDIHRADGEFVLGARSFGITDSLTMLYSHRHFHETARVQAQRAAMQNRPFAIVAVQLTNLGEINATRGFGAGDAALQTVAMAVQREAGRWQGLGFRVSGRRIALIAPGLTQVAADEIAERLRQELSTGPEVRIGSAAWKPGDEGQQVIERALQMVREPAPA